jgi:hypothetical protein
LQCGEPQPAAELLEASAQGDDLRPVVSSALRAHEAARAWLERGYQALLEASSEETRHAVEEAYRAAPADLPARATRALFIRADGDLTTSLEELVRVRDPARTPLAMPCLSTAGAIALELGDLSRAGELLHAAWELMAEVHGGISQIDPQWIPGVASYFHPDGTLERAPSVMADLLEQALMRESADAPPSIIGVLAVKYREAATYLG